MLHSTVIQAVVFVGGLFVVSRVLSEFFRRSEGGITAFGPTETLLKVTAVVGAYVLTVSAEPGDLAAAAAGSQLAAVAVNAVVASGILVAGVAVVQRGLLPLVRELRPGSYTVPDRFGHQFRGAMFAVVLPLALLYEAYRLQVVRVHFLWLVVATIATWAVFLITTFHLRFPPVSLRMRDPTDEERGRIERCYERFGRSPGHIHIVADDADIGANTVGRGRYHVVRVTEQFLEQVDDTTLAVALAEADERSAKGYWTMRICYENVVLTGIALFLLILPGVLLNFVPYPLVFFDAATFSVIVLNSVPLFWMGLPLVPLLFISLPVANAGRERVFKTDQFVVSQFGESTVASVYRQLGEALQHHDPPGEQFRLDPPVEDRLERLDIEPPSAETTEQAEGKGST